MLVPVRCSKYWNVKRIADITTTAPWKSNFLFQAQKHVQNGAAVTGTTRIRAVDAY